MVNIALSIFTDDILENVDESTIPDTLVQRLQEEKWELKSFNLI